MYAHHLRGDKCYNNFRTWGSIPAEPLSLVLLGTLRSLVVGGMVGGSVVVRVVTVNTRIIVLGLSCSPAVQ